MKKIIALLSVGFLLSLLSIAPAFAAGPYTVVLDGLQSPRGLAFGPGGILYVAQAGSGGNTGKITEIRNPWAANPSARDVVSGLLSFGGAGEFESIDGISALGNGGIYGIFGASSQETGLPSPAGHLVKISQGGQIRDIANVGDFDFAWTNLHFDLAPRDFPDANPYGILALPDRIYVADAGANTLNLLRPNGSDEILAFFQNNVIADSTPTCVAKGPDGALYIGTLALVDSLVFGPSAIVYRVDPSAADPNDFSKILNIATPWATGLWPINGCAFGPDGTFYASELITAQDFSGGDVVKIRFSTPDVHTSLTNNALTFPGGVAVGANGSVFVSNGSAEVPVGQVVRLTNH
jgi:hypothetical protein